MSDDRFHMLHWRDGDARLKKCASTSTAKGTTLRIEIEVTDPYRLADLMQTIQEAMRPAPKPEKVTAPRKAALLALPAPQPRLPAPDVRIPNEWNL